MSWLREDIAAQWREEGSRYAGDINKYVHQGMTEGWDSVTEEPAQDERQTLATQIYEMIQAANAQGEIAELRTSLPAATWPLAEQFKDQMQAIRGIHFLGDDGIVFSTGSAWEENVVVAVHQDEVTVFSNYSFIGASPNHEIYALSGKKGITVLSALQSNLQGNVVSEFTWKEINGQIQALCSDFHILEDIEEDGELPLEELIPFDGGKSLLLVTHQGIFHVQQDTPQLKVSLLHPDLEERRQDDMEHTHIDMPHAVVSLDEKWIAFGSQSSDHLLLDRETGQIHSFYPNSSYPHFALFTKDQQQVWYNACHFYNGDTIAVSLEQAASGQSNKDEEWPSVNEEARVYGAVALENGVVIGDAYGYLKLVNASGEELWRQYVGNTISGMTVSADEKMLVVGTYGGMLHFLDLHAPERSDYEIGTGSVRELKRIIAWKDQPKPLWW